MNKNKLEEGDFINKQVLSKLLIIISIILLMFINPKLTYAQNYRCMYAKTTINIRNKPNKKSKIIDKVHWNDKVKVVKKINKKWYCIKYKKKLRYIYADYLSKSKIKYKEYSSITTNTFKSYEDADCITDNINLAQGNLKKKYHLDNKSGVWMIGNRYCIAIGSYYSKKIGTKVDLVLSNKGKKHILKCILADGKADKDTINNHRIHKDGSLVEFVVKTSVLPYKAWYTYGDVSYAGKQFKGKIIKIRIYEGDK